MRPFPLLGIALPLANSVGQAIVPRVSQTVKRKFVCALVVWPFWLSLSAGVVL
jgi:hypothetical protein